MTTVETPTWLTLDSRQGVAIVRLNVTGLDSKRHPKADYRRVIADLVAAGERRIALDLSKLGFANHTWGLFQLVINASNLITPEGGRLAIFGLRGHARRVYNFANLKRFVPAFPSEQAAVDGLLDSLSMPSPSSR